MDSLSAQSCCLCVAQSASAVAGAAPAKPSSLDIAAAAQPLFPVIWEERMGDNLDALRAELGIAAVTEGPCSWYSNPKIALALGL